uniref:Putative secreted protein n=1 Tax=Ixodes ricinus TaxID=34613 RepID=A0A6B0UMR6_IXORI
MPASSTTVAMRSLLTASTVVTTGSAMSSTGPAFSSPCLHFSSVVCWIADSCKGFNEVALLFLSLLGPIPPGRMPLTFSAIGSELLDLLGCSLAGSCWLSSHALLEVARCTEGTDPGSIH